jgi:MFS family permease
VRLPFFYGWLIAGVAGLSSFLGAGLNNVSLGVLLRPLSDDLGWSRSLTAGAIGAGTIAAGLMAPLVGALADRFGPRVLLPTGAALAGALVFAMSWVTEPWAFYATYIPARAIAEPLLVSVVPLTAVANWFQRRRPRSMGFVSMAVPLGSAVLVLWYQLVMSYGGWRAAFVSLAVLFWLGLVVPGAILLRRRPEDVGLVPDGFSAQPGQETSTDRATSELAEPRSWTLREAARTPTLWLLAIANGLAGAATGGTAFNLVAYLTDAQIDPIVAAGALSVFALAGALGSAVWGLLAERVSARALNVGTLTGAACAILLLLRVDAPPLAYLFTTLFGLTARGQGVLIQVQLAQYYGRASYGAISGLLNPFVLGGLGLGPVLAALAFDLSGTYVVVFSCFGVLFLVAAALTGIARPPILPMRGERP